MNMDVALFITCLADTFEPRVGVAVVRLLRHFGCRVHFPEAQTCCGQPLYNNGYHRDAADLGRRWIDVFERFAHVVAPSGSCVAMVRHHLPELLRDDPAYAQRSVALAARTWEFTQFVTDVLKIDPATLVPTATRGSIAADGESGPPAPVTYHYSCHMRGLQSVAQAEQCVRATPGLDYRPLERIEQCCGFGGAFHVLYPEIGAAITADKLDCIASTGASTLICNEVGCAMTIGGLAHRRGVELRIRHIAELWAERLGLT
ncbi:MAG: Lactate utilization protein A [Phycisphaerae bacterium]|nr:Lactate utilization protein A [Phycisphaerae bacterium]